MEVKIVSQETVKPSKPTPNHLRNFRISFLDQIASTIYIPVTLFYIPTVGYISTAQTLTRLKKSLAETLTHFYPFAGRFKDLATVDCNDEGVLYTEAQINRRLSEFLQQLDMGLLTKFFPCNPYIFGNGASDPLVAIQVNTFDCGGIAISLTVRHKIADATTVSVFLKSWAETTGGSFNKVASPDLTSASSLFPPRDPLPTEISSFFGNYYYQESDSIVRRFVFNSTAVATLKAESASETVPNPTRIEALTSFIWNRIISASKSTKGTSLTSVATHAVNLRPRFVPPLPNHSLGNFLGLATALYNPTEALIELPDLVKKLRETFTKLNGNYVKCLQGDQGFELIVNKVKKMATMNVDTNINKFCFTSWCNMGWYSVDFGWGKPTWIGFPGDTFGVRIKRGVIFIETGSGDGIEIWMISNEQEMAILENDPEFLAYASPNPSICTH